MATKAKAKAKAKARKGEAGEVEAGSAPRRPAGRPNLLGVRGGGARSVQIYLMPEAIAAIDAVLRGDEKRTQFMRAAIEAAVARRPKGFVTVPQ